MRKFFKSNKILLVGVAGLAFVFLFFLTRKEQIPSVKGTLPKDGEVGVMVTQDIAITFERPITQSQQKNLTFEFTPQSEYAQIWKVDGVEISPTGSMIPSATYDFRVKFKSQEIHKFSFQTGPLSREQIEVEGGLQSQDDLEFGTAFNSFLEKYPWYPNLPIETEEFTIFYDFQKNSFRIRLKPGINEADAIKNALNRLEKVGVKGPIPYYLVK